MKTNSRILVVDDNTAFCENIADILELHGYEVVAVGDGVKALEEVQADGFDLVLMDIKMPVMNGLEVFKKIKEIIPRLPVILMTAYAVEDLIEEALQGGIFGVLYKPFDPERLFSIIESALPDGALIMVVDDNLELCGTLCDVLDEHEYRVKVAHDGQRAVQMGQEEKFDVILLDMKLPILNGLETHLAIRKIRPDVVTILITGYFNSMEDLVQQAMQEGAYACLEKPLDMERLLNLLRQVEGVKSRGATGREKGG